MEFYHDSTLKMARKIIYFQKSLEISEICGFSKNYQPKAVHLFCCGGDQLLYVPCLLISYCRGNAFDDGY